MFFYMELLEFNLFETIFFWKLQGQLINDDKISENCICFSHYEGTIEIT